MSKISVLMPVRNAERHLGDAIRSILDQTHRDFEFLIMDDGSTDSTWEELVRYGRQDSRIKLFRNERSRGIASCLSALVDLSAGEYLARMDGDDIAYAERFQQQLDHMRNTGADLCGSWVLVFGNGRASIRRYPATDEEIRALLLFVAPFAHPSVMMRRELLRVHSYKAGISMLEDNDLWIRVAHGARMSNIQRPLLKLRWHAGQNSSRKVDERWRRAGELGLDYLEREFGVFPSQHEREVHIGVRHPQPSADLSLVDETESWLVRLHALFDGKPLAQRVIAEQWYRYAIKSASLGPGVYRRYRASMLHAAGGFRGWQNLAVAFLSLMRIRYGSALFRFLVARSPAARA